MWEYTTSNGEWTVFETLGGFCLRYNETGETQFLGDGVDQFQDNDGNYLWPGTDEFYASLQSDIEDDQETYAEAYFGEG